MLRETIFIVGSTLSLTSVSIGNLYYYLLEKRLGCAGANSIFMRIIFTSLLLFHISHFSRNLAYPLVDGKPFKYYISIEYCSNLVLNLTAQLIYLSAIGLELPIWINLLRSGAGSPLKQKIATFIMNRGRFIVFSLMSISLILVFASICLLPKTVLSNLLVMYGSLYVNIPLTTITILPITFHMISILINTLMRIKGVESDSSGIVKKVQMEALKLLASNVMILSFGWLWILVFGPPLVRSSFQDPGPEAYEKDYRLGPSDSIGNLAVTLCWAGFLTSIVFLGFGDPATRIKTYLRSNVNVSGNKKHTAGMEMATQDFLATSVGAKAGATISHADFDGKSIAKREMID